jgi:hypothetical protein
MCLDKVYAIIKIFIGVGGMDFRRCGRMNVVEHFNKAEIMTM